MSRYEGILSLEIKAISEAGEFGGMLASPRQSLLYTGAH